MPRGAPLAKAIMLALNSVNRLASTVLLTGGITPITAAALIGGISWTRWLVLMWVPYYVMLLVASGLIYGLYRRGFGTMLSVPAMEAQEALLGKEIRTSIITIGASLMIAGDAVLYYPAQSASSLVVYQRGHLSGPEIFRFGLWMSLVANLVVLVVALPYWAAVGEPLVMRPGE